MCALYEFRSRVSVNSRILVLAPGIESQGSLVSLSAVLGQSAPLIRTASGSAASVRISGWSDKPGNQDTSPDGSEIFGDPDFGPNQS